MPFAYAKRSDAVRSDVIPQLLSSKSPRRSQSYWATISLFVPLVVQRLFIGGVTGGYDTYNGLSFAWLGYIIHGLLVFLFLIKKPINKNSSNLFYILIMVFFISIAQLFYVNSIFTGNLYSILFVLLRAILWILALYSFSVLFFEIESFKSAFYDIILFSGLFVILCGLIYNILGIPLGVNIEKGLGRVHGAFSEPSTLASVFPAFTFIALMNKRYFGLFVGLLAIYWAASVVVTVSFAILLAIYIFIKRPVFNYAIVCSVVLFAIFMTLSLNADAVNRLDYWTVGFSKFLDSTIGDSVFRTYTIDRLITSVHDLATSLNYATDIKLEESGGLARLLGSITMLRNMDIDGTTWFGYGLSVYGFVANALYGTALDFGLFPYLVSSFGILLGTISILVIALMALRWQYRDYTMFLIFVGGLVGTLYNSGGGITAYTVVVLCLFIPIANRPDMHNLSIQTSGEFK